MKTKIKRMSKRTLAMLLGVLMLVTSIGLGTLFTATAATTVYFFNTGNWSNVYVHNWSGGTGTSWPGTTATLVDSNLKLYSCEINSGNTKCIFNNNNGTQTSDLDINTSNPYYVYNSGWYSYENAINAAGFGRVVAGDIASSGWSNTADVMDYNNGAYSFTYSEKAAGSYTFAIVTYGDWNATSYRWAAKGTLTDNSIASWADANDGDHNIKLTTTAKSNITITLTSSNKVNVTVTPVATNYTGITAVAKGTTDGSNYSVDLGSIQSSTTVSSTTGLSVSAPTQSGYTFSKWVASGSGTFDSATSASTTFHPAANSEIATAQYKKNYTFSNGTTDTHGTVTVPSGTVLAGASYSGKVTPAEGYKIKSLTVGGNTVTAAAGKTSAYTYSGTTGSSTTGTSTPISVVATFEANTAMNLYIAGRFHVKDSSGNWVNTFGSSGDWNATSTKIPFTYLSGTTYKVDTNATLAELSGKISNYDPVFFVYDTTNSKNWYASSATTMSTSGTTLVSSGGADSNLKFSSTSTDGPVTVYYDTNTHKIWYSIPDLYDVTVDDTATGGSVTASPSRTQENATVTLTISPLSGYQLSSITAKQGSTNVTLSGTGDTRTFTMPAGDVTVTPVFSKIDYTLTKNSTSNGSFKLTNASGTEITKAQIGDTVKVVPNANEGYQVGTVKHGTTSTPNTSITASGGTYSFTMGAANEYVAVTFTEVTGTAVAKAYTSGSASNTGGTVKVGSGTAGASANATVGIATSATVVAAAKTNYSFTGWQFSGDNATKLRYRFGTSGDWLTPATGTTYGTASNTTIYIKTDGSSEITTSNAEVRALFVETDYTGLTVGAQYTENNSTYTDFDTTPSGVTIADNHGTNQTGVAVTAPATDPTGYVFAGWYTANGSFANSANKDTTFKPNAANAKAYARYKKIYNITYSVDDTGTGAGTVTTSVATVVAGGSYTITATAKSGSAIESVKVNGTAKTATASQTISSVSADQTVVVKFKSNVYLKGTMNSTAWAGDVMKANSAGTTYTKSEVTLNAGTTYEFKHWVDSGGNGTYSITVDTWTLNNIATHSTKSDGYGGTNLTITPSVKAKVTFVSDGTKFTSITAIPYDSTQHNVTLTQSADYTITSTYMGVEYTTSGKNANVTVPVYSGTELSYTVTPASGKYLSGVAQSDSVALSPAFSATTHASSYTGTVSSVSKAFAVSATAASKLTVAAKTNKSSRGTVSVDKSTVAPGESITITVSPKNGQLTALTATYASGNVYTCNLSTKEWTKNTKNGALNASGAGYPSMALTAAQATRIKKSLFASGAGVSLNATGADTTYTMTLAEDSAVTINATFDAYSAESTWYYNGYDTSGNALSGYHTKQMTESMVSGQKFSYYHVEGRSGSDQLMTVSDGVPSSGTRYVYFTRPSNWGTWSGSNNPKAYFWNSGGTVGDEWPGTEMSWQWNNDMGEGVYKVAIPTGATNVKFNDASSNEYRTVAIDLTTTSGAYYLSGGGSGTDADGYHVSEWNTGWADQGWVESGKEYFYRNSTYNGDYTGDFNTKGFNNHYTASKDFAKPKDLGSNTGDYYINVLYPNTSYTINGVTKTTGSNPMIIWSAEPLAGDDENVKIYAKDGSIRSDSSGSTYANIADTKIYAADGSSTVGTKHNGNVTNQTYETYNAGMGDTIVIKTQIGATDSGTLDNAADLKAKYYVRGFCVNGEVSELLDWNSDGLYTLTYKVPEDEELKKVEITPIYYLKDTSANPIVTYRVTGFTDELKAVGSGKPNWGDTLYTYPFYGKLGSNNNALGAYPGQPMVYYKGQYQMQIPQKSTAWDIYESDSALGGKTGSDAATAVANTPVSGVTMSNGYYDIVHRQVMGYGSNGSSADHVQTYDYGDFYKIFNEKSPVDNIVFDFKYETTTHNLEATTPTSPTPSNLTSTYQNGFELLTNFHGRTVDLFGTPLSGDAADTSKTKPLYVVSIGGVNGSAGVENIAGYYATEWKVFAPNTTTGTPSSSDSYKLVTNGKESIPPEVLVLNNSTTSFNDSTYPSADANHKLTDWQALYTSLEDYRNIPVMISYEAADAQIGAGNYATSGSGGATRNDGRWLYSKNGENITSNIKIQYSDDNGATYTDLNTTTPQVSGLSAYFTNAEADGEMTFATTIDPDKTFDFTAQTSNPSYKFVGWFMEDGTKITSDNTSHTERSGSYTFVAKFMQVSSGQLILSHQIDKSDASYQGDGTTYIAVRVENGDGETVRTVAETTGDITLDDKVIKSDNTDYRIYVDLRTVPTGEDTFHQTTCSAANKFMNNSAALNVADPEEFSFTVGDLFTNINQDVMQIIYKSNLNKTKYTYDLTFVYRGREGTSNQSYRRQGTLTAAQREAYVDGTGDADRVLNNTFMNRVAPHESNFNQDYKWVFTTEDKTFTKDANNNYTITKTYNIQEKTSSDYVEGEKQRSKNRTVTFKLPYAHDEFGHATSDSLTETTEENFDVTVQYGKVIKKDYPADVAALYPEGSRDNSRFRYYVTAPKTLTIDGEAKTFQYWSMFKSTDTECENEIAKCYYISFNYSAYDNYIVKPFYDTSAPESEYPTSTSTTINFLETSRNQWNDGGNGGKVVSGTSLAATDANNASDILYNDFQIAFTLADGSVVKDSNANIGIVIEKLGELETAQDGTYKTDAAEYISKYSTVETDKIKTFANGGSNGGLALSRAAITKSNLDNKDMIDYCYRVYNSIGWENEKAKTTYTNKNNIYRAFSYIIVDGVVTLSEKPVYFTMYDEASK